VTGSSRADFCHIDNVVEANFAAAVADAGRASGGVFNIGCGEAIDLNRVVALIGDILGRKLERCTNRSAPATSNTPGATSAPHAPALGFRAGLSVPRRSAPYDRVV
jgi:nucleoside-diphosphate-sugar epimerase